MLTSFPKLLTKLARLVTASIASSLLVAGMGNDGSHDYHLGCCVSGIKFVSWM